MSLLAELTEKVSKANENIESFRAKITNLYVVSVAEDGSWRRVCVETPVATVYGFESALAGIKVTDFIPDAGIDAQITIKKRTYVDKDGKDAVSYDMIGCKADMMSYRAGVLKGTGLIVNLF